MNELELTKEQLEELLRRMELNGASSVKINVELKTDFCDATWIESISIDENNITDEREVEEVKKYILELVEEYFEEMLLKPNTKELRDKFAERLNSRFEMDEFPYHAVCDETTNPHDVIMQRAIGFNVVPNEDTVVYYDNHRKFCITVR